MGGRGPGDRAVLTRRPRPSASTRAPPGRTPTKASTPPKGRRRAPCHHQAPQDARRRAGRASPGSRWAWAWRARRGPLGSTRAPSYPPGGQEERHGRPRDGPGRQGLGGLVGTGWAAWARRAARYSAAALHSAPRVPSRSASSSSIRPIWRTPPRGQRPQRRGVARVGRRGRSQLGRRGTAHRCRGWGACS